MKKKWLGFILLLPILGLGQWQLSPQAKLSVITCGPGQNELYSAFGHSAVRVRDPKTGFDLLYNYGVFDFDQPNFYLNFTKGNLLYKLAVTDYERFVGSYIREGRYVHEQVLNLTPGQKQAYFNFLQINALPENTTYQYDYFYDNCATRIRDGLKAVLGDTLVLDSNYVTTQYSIRDLCNLYLTQQPWGDLGIDICLGLPMDKRATPYEYMFLPDYLEKGLTSARLKLAGQSKPLVAEMKTTFAGEPQDSTVFFTPLRVTLALLVLVALLSVWQYQRKKYSLWPDFLLFFGSGTIGLLLTVLWFFTDHEAAASNYNLLWALPLHFFMAFSLLMLRWRLKFTRVFLGLAAWHLVVAIFWFGFPQDLHHALWPLNVLIALRFAFIYLIHKKP